VVDGDGERDRSLTESRGGRWEEGKDSWDPLGWSVLCPHFVPAPALMWREHHAVGSTSGCSYQDHRAIHLRIRYNVNSQPVDSNAHGFAWATLEFGKECCCVGEREWRKRGGGHGRRIVVFGNAIMGTDQVCVQVIWLLRFHHPMKVVSTPKPKTMRRTFRCPLDLKFGEVVRLRFWLAACAYVYNWALTRRCEQYAAWKAGTATKKGLTCFDQKKELVAFRTLSFALLALPSDVLRSAIDRLEKAFDGFFRRVAEGSDPGFPRYRKHDRYDSFSFPWADGMIVGTGRSARLRIPKFGMVKLNLYRELRGTPKQITIQRESTGKWWACISCDLGEAPAKLAPIAIQSFRMVGIDLGLISLIATSDGEVVDNPRHFKKSQKQLAARQRRMEKETQPGSNGRRVARRLTAKCHKHIANQRKDFAWKLAKTLVKTNDLISLEKLNIKALCASALGKHVNHAAWGKLIHAIRCKAEEAGTLVVEVDPRYTSQECCGCGNIKPKDLSERWHHCSLCGMSLDRDVNAARVVLARGVAALGTSADKASTARCVGKARRSMADGGGDAATQP
jgi:putative transposase